MNQLEQLFKSLLKFFFGIRRIRRGFGVRSEVRAAVCGIFARAEVNFKDPNIANYHDNSEELPAKFRFQVWLRDWNNKVMVENVLRKWSAKTENGFGFEERAFERTSDPKGRA
jgi:hypothetical protein